MLKVSPLAVTGPAIVTVPAVPAKVAALGVPLLHAAEPEPVFQLLPPLVHVPLPPVKFAPPVPWPTSQVSPLPMVICRRTSVSTL